MNLNPQELKRYHRHLLLPEIGKEGQLKLKNAKVLVVGAGGLGSPALFYLSAAGVGTIGVIDPDKVEFSNLQRQILHFTNDQGKPKVVSAKEKITQLNPDIEVITYQEALKAHNAMDIIKNYDLVVDGTDNFPARYLINDACVLLKKPFVYGGIFRFEGQCSVFGFKNGPCYRCFFEEPPAPGEVPSCAEAGVLGVLPGMIGLIQTNEAIKIICQIGESLSGRLLLLDALQTQFREVQIKKNPNCPMCGNNPTIQTLTDYEVICETKGASMEVSVQELKKILDQNAKKVVLLDVREQMEWDMARIEGAVLKPLSTLEEDYKDIPKDKTIYVHCKVGGRSRRAIEFLRSKGYENLYNVAGGIDAWSQEIDPSVPSY